jgi:hypothetical protein
MSEKGFRRNVELQRFLLVTQRTAKVDTLWITKMHLNMFKYLGFTKKTDQRGFEERIVVPKKKS